jgi:predicted transcriptional regulator
MKEHPMFVNSEDSIKKVADILIKEEFHALPVLQDDILVGIVTTTDIIKHLIS